MGLTETIEYRTVEGFAVDASNNFDKYQSPVSARQQQCNNSASCLAAVVAVAVQALSLWSTRLKANIRPVLFTGLFNWFHIS